MSWLKKSYDIQENNKLFIVKNGKLKKLKKKILGLEIKVYGKNNTIIINDKAHFINSIILIENDNAYIEIGESLAIHNFSVRVSHGNGQILKIGNNTSIYGCAIHLNDENGCEIGEDCMFSDEIRIWASDGHAIYDSTTGLLLNGTNYTVKIGNHCWIGQGCKFLKKGSIGNNCVIGASSIVCNNIPENNAIVVGNPAKVIKRGINWTRESPYLYKKSELQKNGGKNAES